jgi:TPR repeat protein
MIKIIKRLGIGSLVMLGMLSFSQAGNLAELEKRCSSGDGNACATLGAVHAGLGGKRIVQKDMNKAKEFWKKGCELNSGSACTTYSMVIQDEDKRVKVLKKACDLGNENGCLVYNQTIMMQELQVDCVEKQNLRSCGKIGGEVFLVGEYNKGKEILDDMCKVGDKTSCMDLKIIEASKEFVKLSFVEDLKKKCSEKKDKFACEKVGGFLIGINGYVMSSVKTDADKKSAVPEVMMNLMMGQVYIKEACSLGRKESCRTLKGLEAAQKKSTGGK